MNFLDDDDDDDDDDGDDCGGIRYDDCCGLDKTNRENLDAIERCIFVLCLDGRTPESMLSRSQGGASVSDRPQRGDVSLAEQMIHGHGSRINSANRWFEKTMQVNAQHSSR